MDLIPEPVKFEWDKGNLDKNINKHGIKNQEAEEVFVNKPAVLVDDKKHSKTEKRYMILGRTDSARKLSVFFTLRRDRVRIISSRPMSVKERRLYEQKAKSYTEI